MTQISDAWMDFAAGWCSGAVAVMACQPVDTLLTRCQAGVLIGSSGSQATHIFTTEARAFCSSQGIKALWRGASPMITAVPLQNALLMGGYGIGQAWYAKDADAASKQQRWMAIFIGGCVGGVVQSFLMSPVELIKVSQQCRAVDVKAASQQVLKSIVSGSPVAWRGLGATLLRDGIPHGVWFLTYEACKEAGMAQLAIDESDETPDMPVAVPLISGAVAATVAWGVGYPADLIKTRIQYNVNSSSSSQMGIVATGQQLVREANGNVLTGLYRGFGIKLVRAVPASMIGFCVYEFVKKQIQSL